VAKLFLVRHGNTFGPGDICVQVGAKTDLDLVESGRAQAVAVAGWIEKNHITPSAVYSGPLKRHIQSAELVASRFKIEPKTGVEALNEIDFGVWEGLTPEQIEGEYPDQYQAWKSRAEWPADMFEGELSQRIAQIKSWVRELSETYSADDSVVAISSGGNIRYFYSLLSSEWRKLVRDGSVGTLKVGTGRICELEVFSGSIKVLSWNVPPS